MARLRMAGCCFVQTVLEKARGAGLELSDAFSGQHTRARSRRTIDGVHVCRGM